MGEITNLFCTHASQEETVNALKKCAYDIAELKLTDVIEDGMSCEYNITCHEEIVGVVNVTPIQHFTDGFAPEDFHDEVTEKGAEEFLREIRQHTTHVSFTFFESKTGTCIKPLSSLLQRFIREIDASLVDPHFAMIFSQKEITEDMLFTAVTGRWTLREKANLARACCLGGFLLAPLFLLKSVFLKIIRVVRSKPTKG